MLGDKTASAVLAVKDLDAAKKFYAQTVGLKEGKSADEGGALFMSGQTPVFIYPSQYAGTNQATALTWAVGGDFDKIVDDLKGKGVSFEHYDIPGMTQDGDVHKMGDLRSVWFKDPSGNILNIIDHM